MPITYIRLCPLPTQGYAHHFSKVMAVSYDVRVDAQVNNNQNSISYGNDIEIEQVESP